MNIAPPLNARATVQRQVASPAPSSAAAMIAEIKQLSVTLKIAPESKQQFLDLVTLMAWQRGQPQQLEAPTPFDCTVTAPQVVLDDAVMGHHLAQMMAQGADGGLEQIRQCLAKHDAQLWGDYAATRGMAAGSGFNDWPDTLKAAALRAICLRDANLTTLNVEGIDLRGIDLQLGAIIPSERMMELRLRNLPGARFDQANLFRVHAEFGHLEGAHFNGATLTAFDTRRVEASNAQFTAARLSNVTLSGNFRDADFTDAQGVDVALRGNYAGANFSRAHLAGVDLGRADTPNFFDACFEQAAMMLSEDYLRSLQDISAWSFSFAGTPHSRTLLETLNSIDDRWVQIKAGLMCQVLETLSQWPDCDAALTSHASALERFAGMARSPFYADKQFATDFINRHLLPAMAVVPALIQPFMREGAGALLAYWCRLVTDSSWEELAPAQLALQRVLFESSYWSNNVALRQAWLARPEVATLLSPEARDLIGADGHVLVLGEVALIYDRGNFGAEFMRITPEDLDSVDTLRERMQVAVFARDADKRVRRQHPRWPGGAELAVSRLARQVLAQAPLCIDYDERRDYMLNHRNNDNHSVLRNIDEIIDCDALRLGLMTHLVAALGRNPDLPGHLRDDAALTRSLTDVLLDNPLYAARPDIAAFNQQHLLPLLVSHWSQHVLSAEDALQPSVNQLASHLAMYVPGAEWDVLSGQQLAVQQVSTATGHTALRRAWQERPEVAPVVHALEEVETGLSHFSQVLVAPGGRSAIAYEDETFKTLLTVPDPAQWNRAYVFDGNEDGTGFASTALDDLERRLTPFPVLLSLCRAGEATQLLNDMISISIPSAFAARFRESLRVSRQTDKLLEPQQQIALTEQMLSRLQGPVGGSGEFDAARLDPTHSKALIDVYRTSRHVDIDMGDATHRTRAAALMLGLARLYTEFSSSYRFGSETDSPQALRLYVAALLNEVQALAPSLLPIKAETDGLPVSSDWKRRLQGADGAFTCTAVLASEIKRTIESLDPALQEICSSVYPHAWR